MTFISAKQSLSNQELIDFFEVIENFVATMPKSGVEEGIKAIIEDEEKDSYLYKVGVSILRDIENGHTFSEALAKFPQSFPPFVVGIIGLSEQTGQLEKAIKEIMFRQKLQDTISATIDKATFMPKISAGIGVVIFFASTMFVIPKMGETLGSLGTELPFFTRAVMGFGDFMLNWWLLWLVLAVVLIVGYGYCKKMYPETIAALRLRVPFWRPIESNQIKYDFCSIMGICIEAGVEPNQALNYTALATDSIFLRGLIARAKRLLTNGVPFDEALKSEDKQGILDKKLYRILYAGRSTGKTGYNMKMQSEFYRNRLMMATDAIGDKVGMVVITPILALVAILLTAITLPIMSLGTNLVNSF